MLGGFTEEIQSQGRGHIPVNGTFWLYHQQAQEFLTEHGGFWVAQLHQEGLKCVRKHYTLILIVWAHCSN